ncbi:hypothetical protein K2Z83_05110 [Oscillochloris sp. ZM17-4]|uniref:hypothetical protein n=1 Tax=Oscillochloris sp. ZM17-4 TaxID=2866714 RepID=UPI001C72AD04|nr:hypothetical protein [Oscillochloris sp. ZM17-4]MBX0327062.1 hypothetical protein [Oscillochloris sp. ZM17-4]
MKTYRLSPAGRRTSIVLLVGALLIWAFALWSFVSTLGLSLSVSQFVPSLQASLASGLGVGQVVPALLMLAMIVATPLLIWNILEEWSAAYAAGEDGLRFESIGITIALPWSAVAGLRPADDDGDEPLDEIMLRQDAAAQIANPLLRFLHRQAYGARRLPVYAGLEDRAELLNEIRRNITEPLNG